MGYRYTESEPEIFIKRATTENGTSYYKCMLVYIDDVIHLARDAQEDILNLNQVYLLKEGFGPPDRYLGSNVDTVQLEYGRIFWYITCVEYLSGYIKNIYSILEGNKAALKSFGGGHCPYPSSYRPELDVTDEFDEELTNRFQNLIGFIRWSIELVRIDIMTEVSCFSQHVCSSCEEHLDTVYKVFRCLQKNLSKNPGRISFDPDFVHTY